MDAAKINEIDQSLQSVIIAYQHNAENRAVLDLASHDARRVLNRDSYHQMNCLSMHGSERGPIQATMAVNAISL